MEECMEMDTIQYKHILIIGLGYNKYLHDEIDKVYEKRRWEYYEEFKKSEFLYDEVISSFTTVQEDKMKKVAGIVEWSIKNNDIPTVFHLIKKGYKDVFRYYQQNKNRLNIQEFTQYIIKKKGMTITNVSELEMIANQCILISLASIEGLNLGPLFASKFGELVAQSIQNLGSDLKQADRLKEEILGRENVYQKVVNFIFNAIGINIESKIPSKIDNLIDLSIDIEVRNKLEKIGFRERAVDVNVAQQIRNNLYEEGNIRHLGTHSSILKMTKLNYIDLLNVDITKEDLMVYAYNAMNRIEGNNYSPKEAEQLFISSIFIHAVVQQYKVQKEVLFNDTQESWYLDVKKREQRIEEKEKSYKKETDKLTAQKDAANFKFQELKKKNGELEKEIERLRKQLADTKEEKEELVELRNFAYNQERVDVEIDELSVKEAAKYLDDKKIIVCGGHPNMQIRLKEWLPNLETLSTDTLGKNFSYLRNYDVIYFYPNYANHSFYKKIKQAIVNTKTKFVYLPDNDNVAKLLLEMHKSINGEKVHLIK